MATAEALVEVVKHGSVVHVDQALVKHGKDINRSVCCVPYRRCRLA